MRKTNEKLNSVIFSVLLITSIFAALSNLEIADAETSTKATFAYIGATPNPIGVGQETLIHIGITDPIGTANNGWEGLTLTITRPDGVNETIKDIKTDSTGGTGRVFVPTMAGNYTLQTHFPEQICPINTGGGFSLLIPQGTIMLESFSEPLTLVVQEDPVVIHPGFPLPTEYWMRPIDSQLREWYSVSGNWLLTPGDRSPPYDQDRIAPYNDGPETSHILWTKPLTTGGLAGGKLGLVGAGATSVGMETGDAYEGKWPGPIIMAGKLYYTVGGARGVLPVETHCVDLHTGEELWSKIFLDNRTIAFGQLFYWQSYNDQGVFPYLWTTVGTTWSAFDAFTGDWRYTIKNVPSGTTLRDETDGLYRLQVNQQKGWMALWNASALGSMEGSWGNTVHMKTLDAAATKADGTLTTEAARAWMWNVTIPTNLPGSICAVGLNDRVVGINIGTTKVNVWGLSLESGREGYVLFNKVWNAPSDWVSGNKTISVVTSSLEDQVGVLMAKELVQHYGFSLGTGDLLWGPTPSQYYLDMYADQLTTRIIAYGKLYSCGVAGIVYCYDVKTGGLEWTYKIDDPYTENLFANNWWSGILFITDGKLYLGSAEHSANQPMPRGAPFVCLDAETGDLIWRANGLFRQTLWGGLAIIGDSIITAQDTYDQRIYAIGKGPSATSILIQDDIVKYGDSVLIKGTVTDVSPGTNTDAMKLRFPNGVPAVSDESMSDWMLYVYKQLPKPTNITGIQVELFVIDANQNYRSIGTTTTDDTGFYSLQWMPDIPGKYTVYAKFTGSQSYWSSQATTAFAVDEAEATPSPTETPPSTVEQYFWVAVAAIIIAIFIVGAIIILFMLRKKE